uniref:Cadherin domain-containing protein n=1 Tax=Loa loa TaxID=7209 RepID=A0A1I7VQF1_LOALO
MAVLLSLPVSLLVSTLRLHITTRMALLATSEISDQSSNMISGNVNSDKYYFVMRLLSKNRNLTFFERNGNLFADSLLIGSLDNNAVNTLNIICSNDISLRITMNNNISKTMLSPSLCRRNSQLKVQIGGTEGNDEGFFDGCVGNVTIAAKVLLDRWCSSDEKSQQHQQQQQQQQQNDINEQSDGPRPPPHHMGLPHFTEPLILDEGTIAPIQKPPQHGQLLKYDQPINQFAISDITTNKIFYKHDDSETTVDSIGLETVINSPEMVASKRNMIYNIPIRINPVNDAPELKSGIDSKTLWITGDSKLTLDNRAISLWDADNDPETVFVSVIAADGVQLEDSGRKKIQKFTQGDFLNNDLSYQFD